MPLIKELVVITGEYTTASGEQKKRYRRIGDLHQNDKGQYITLDSLINLAAVPRKEGDDRVFVSMFDPKPKDGQKTSAEPTRRQAQPAKSAGPSDGGFDDDPIPF